MEKKTSVLPSKQYGDKNMLEQLRAKNQVPVYSVKDAQFKTYGRIVEGYDFREWMAFMEENTQIPEQGNVYVASVEELEKMNVFQSLQSQFYGGMPIEAGYCNGRNTTYNGFEYHKGSEINIAVTDFMLVLGHTWDICDNTYKVEDAEVFFVEKGTAIEMYQTTLHLSPCRVCDEGFKGIVVLPRRTNTPLKEKKMSFEAENQLLLQTNKWVLAHPEREPLIRQGAHPGVLGENKELFY